MVTQEQITEALEQAKKIVEAIDMAQVDAELEQHLNTTVTPGYGYRIEISFCIDQQGRNKAVFQDRNGLYKRIPIKKAKELIAAGYADRYGTK